MFYYLSIGVLLGLTAGLSPGPLLALIISETLEHGFSAGVKVALAPMLTDAPILVGSLLVFTQLADIEPLLGGISLVGGCYIFYLGYKSLSPQAPDNTEAKTGPDSWAKGIFTNALSPHPYLFWMSIGAPTIATSSHIHSIAPLLFVGGFYVFLVGTKILLAVVVSKSRHFLSNKAYRYSMSSLGLALMAFSVVLFADGLKFLGLTEVPSAVYRTLL